MPPGNKDIIIVGAGETAELAWEYFTHDSPCRVAAFAVEERFLKSESFCGLPVVPVESVTDLYPPTSFGAFVAVSYVQLNRPRARLVGVMQAKGYGLVSYVSSRAFVWRTAAVGRNCLVLENNVLQHGVTLDDDVYLWSGNHVGHRTRIGAHTFVSSHIVISGFCDIGTSCFLGVNACISDHIAIADDTVLGAGAVVVRDTEPGRIYVGNPAVAGPHGSLARFGVRGS
jgi:sugar O-acyltransferase (sialic acid O-acetyltransferase NeuD family)